MDPGQVQNAKIFDKYLICRQVLNTSILPQGEIIPPLINKKPQITDLRLCLREQNHQVNPT